MHIHTVRCALTLLLAAGVTRVIFNFLYIEPQHKKYMYTFSHKIIHTFCDHRVSRPQMLKNVLGLRDCSFSQF